MAFDAKDPADHRPEPIPEWPPLTGRTLFVAVVLVSLGAAVSHVFAMGG